MYVWSIWDNSQYACTEMDCRGDRLGTSTKQVLAAVYYLSVENLWNIFSLKTLGERILEAWRGFGSRVWGLGFFCLGFTEQYSAINY